MQPLIKKLSDINRIVSIGTSLQQMVAAADQVVQTSSSKTLLAVTAPILHFIINFFPPRNKAETWFVSSENDRKLVACVEQVWLETISSFFSFSPSLHFLFVLPAADVNSPSGRHRQRLFSEN